MKKILIVLLFAGLTATIFYACKKNAEPMQNNMYPEKQYTADEMALWRKLNNFNQKIKNGLKSEEFITPDSAMWYLEALFNATQTTDTTFDEVIAYEGTYSLNVNTNGTVNMSEVINVYNQLVADLEIELGQINSGYKFLIMADLEQTSLKSGGFTMTLTGGVAISPLYLYQPITATDNWRSGNMKGKCTNSDFDSDAGIELRRRFNNPYLIARPINCTWTNVQLKTVWYVNYPNRIFHESASSEPCVNYSELQNYLIEGHYIIYNTAVDYPTGERPDGLTYNCMILWTNNNSPSDGEYWHKYQISYGIPVSIPDID